MEPGPTAIAVAVETSTSLRRGSAGGRASRGASIRLHLSALSLMLLLPSLALGAMIVSRFAADRRSEVEIRLVRTASDLAAEISAELENAVTVLRTLSFSSRLDELTGFAEQARRSVQGVGDAVLLVEAGGRVLASTQEAAAESPGAYGALDTLTDALSAGEPRVGNLASGAGAGEPRIDIVFPLAGRTGPGRALVLSIPAQRFEDIARRHSVPPVWRAGVTDRRNVLIAHGSRPVSFVGTPLTPELIAANDRSGTIHRAVSVDGEPIVRAVAQTRIGGWRAAAAVTQEHVDGFVRDSLRAGVLGCLAVLALAAGLVALYGRRLALAFEDVAAGRAGGRGAAFVREAGDAVRRLNDSTAALRDAQRSLAAAMDVAGVAPWGWDERKQLKLWTPQAKALFGLPPTTQMTRELFESLLRPEDLPVYREAWSRALATGSYACEYRIVRPSDGAVRWIESRASVDFIDGVPVLVTGALRDVTEEREAVAALEASEERLRLALEAAEAGVIAFDLEHAAATWSEQAKRLIGAEGEGPDFETMVERFVAPAHRAHVRAAVLRAEADDIRASVEIPILHPQTGARWLAARFRLRWRDGRVVAALGLLIDVTDRKRADERIRLLMREVDHRAKNLLSVVGSIARQTARVGREDFAERLTDRISALAACLDLLIHQDGSSVDLAELVEAQIAPFGDFGPRIRVKGPPVLITPAAAQNIGLALHELGTNAVKYGALSGEAGAIDISWRIFDVAGCETFELEWRESGGPPPRATGRRGFGTTVVTDMAAMGAQGNVLYELPDSGCRWRLTCPLEALRRRSARTDATAQPLVVAGGAG